MHNKNLFTKAALWIGFAATTLLPVAQAQDAIRHLNQEEATKAAISRVQPEYPAMAKQLHLEGVVQVQANIDEKGSVDSVKVLSGNVVLANAAAAALKRWKFAPLSADGKSARGSATLSFTFKM